MTQVLVRGHGVGNIEGRQQRGAELELEVDLVRDLEGGRQRLGQVLEDLDHLGRRLQVVLLGRKSPAVGIVEAGARLQAEENVVGLRVVTVHVVEVVGRA